MTEKWVIEFTTSRNEEIVSKLIRGLLDNTDATGASFHKEPISQMEGKTE